MGLIVDNFAGGGGASLGIEMALGRSPDIAVDHDPEAIAMHATNHPHTTHLRESVWDVDPVEACAGRPVDLAWFSPDCKHFSRAKGGKPVEKKIRGLAWVAIRWAKAVRPSVIVLENVPEFVTWGPLVDDRPCPIRRGLTFRRFVGRLHALGYAVEWCTLSAADYGAPTTRKRLFLIARCDGAPIVWPTPTHGPMAARPWRTAAECIDWAIPCPSIFSRSRPLAEATHRRIARGLREFVLDARRPFMAPLNDNAVAFLVHQSNGERVGQAPRIYDAERPLGTVVASGVSQALVVAWLAKHYGGNESSAGGSALDRPIDTITAVDHHALVAAFLVRYNGTSSAEPLDRPLGTVTARDRYALATVTIDGHPYRVRDIGHRMLTPRELARAQGFPDSYAFAPGSTKTAQVRLIGNSVAPPIAAAIVRANVGDRVDERKVA